MNHKGAQRCVTDHTHRRRIGGDALKAVQVRAQRVGHDGLDHVAVRTGQPQHVAVVGLGEAAVVLADRGHGAGLYVCQAFTCGEHRGAGLLLHHRPQRLLDQVADLASGPLAVVHLGEAFVDDGLQAERSGQRFDGALASQHRRAHDRADRQRADAVHQGVGLLVALVIEVDALGPAGQRVRGVRRRAAVPQQDDRHVVDHHPVPSRISTPCRGAPDSRRTSTCCGAPGTAGTRRPPRSRRRTRSAVATRNWGRGAHPLTNGMKRVGQ